MNISIAENSGFCTGVRLAVEKALETSRTSDTPIYCLGDIIHNNDVIKQLEKRGIRTVKQLDEVEEGSTVLIRTHGIGEDVYKEMKAKDIRIVDATCVYVKKIHQLVKQNHAQGKKIIIIGDKDHPEVKGINGWCGYEAFIIDSVEQIEQIPFELEDEVAIFSQTTFEKDKYRKIIDKIKIKFKNLLEFDTICKSTLKRQENAKVLSSRCDIMIVLGGERSSNTKKLYDICRQNCEETYLAENLSKLPKDIDLKEKTVGITAGASTPADVIEEVYSFMSESAPKEKEINFEDAINQATIKLSSGTIVKGKVLSKTDSEVYVDVSYKSDGILPAEEFNEPDEFEKIEPGEEIEVYVTRVNDGEGSVLLSKKRIDSIRNSDKIRKAYEEKTPMDVKVKKTVKGGVIAGYKGAEIFVPASQIRDSYIKDLSTVVGETLRVLITEYNPRKNRVIGSARILMEKEKEEQLKGFWEEIEIGKTYKGTIKSFVDFGAFVNIGPIDGLLHISEMSWSQIEHPSELFKNGQEIATFVLSYDKEKKKVSLGYRKEEDNPWHGLESEISVDEIIQVRIVRLVPFGAFAEIRPGVEGLIHISNISYDRIGHPAEVLKIDQLVDVKVLEMDIKNKRVALSIKDTQELKVEAKPEPQEAEEKTHHREELDVSLGDVLDFNIKE